MNEKENTPKSSSKTTKSKSASAKAKDEHSAIEAKLDQTLDALGSLASALLSQREMIQELIDKTCATPAAPPAPKAPQTAAPLASSLAKPAAAAPPPSAADFDPSSVRIDPPEIVVEDDGVNPVVGFYRKIEAVGLAGRAKMDTWPDWLRFGSPIVAMIVLIGLGNLLGYPWASLIIVGALLIWFITLSPPDESDADEQPQEEDLSHPAGKVMARDEQGKLTWQDPAPAAPAAPPAPPAAPTLAKKEANLSDIDANQAEIARLRKLIEEGQA